MQKCRENRNHSREIKKIGEDLESGERLRGWLEAYGIEKVVKGSEKHVERIRGAAAAGEKRGENVQIQSETFKFTFRKNTEKVQEKAV